MKNIEVLGSGCTKCNKTFEAIETQAKQQGAEIEIHKNTSPEALLTYGVMRTPAVVVDGKLVHSGSIPHTADIAEWLK
ncbi:thioredoxin family protein [Oceanobacter mangrovi]|uniref:thioredoxin family protein n=1 Tax=Oceanobacter mangrovi TaxID=2862510 RepID=UPI001C8E2E43|nr:thioredoxin family protein [Oceanobacter mangrovi]